MGYWEINYNNQGQLIVPCAFKKQLFLEAVFFPAVKINK